MSVVWLLCVVVMSVVNVVSVGSVVISCCDCIGIV